MARSVTSGKGPIQALAEHGIYTNAPKWLHTELIDGIRLGNILFNGGRIGNTNVSIRIDDSCTRLMDCLENTAFPTDQRGNRLPGIETPQDNEWTHMTDSFRYLVHWICRTMLGSSPSQLDVEHRPAFTAGVQTRTF
jgi:hypothetical protein